MSRGRWAVVALLAVSGALASGCGGKPSRGIHGQVIDSSGKVIPNAEVSVVEMPPGGMDELVRMVHGYQHEGKSLLGWHFTTDDKGRFCLTGIPTGGMVVAGMTVETPRYSYPPPKPEGGETFGEAFRRGYESAMPRVQKQYTYQQGPWIGLVILAPGYRPYIAKWRFGGRHGDMKEAITLDELGQARLDLDTAGFTVTLAPLPAGSGRAAVSDGTANGPRVPVRTRVLHVPASALAHYRASAKVEQPWWGPGQRGAGPLVSNDRRGK